MAEILEPTREEKKRERGCVVRAIQTTFNRPVSEEMWDYRLQQTDQLRSTTGRWRDLPHHHPQKAQLIRQEYWQEISNFLTFLEFIKQSNSDLGEAIKAHQMIFMSGKASTIEHFLNQNGKILLAMPHHIMHIGRLPGTRLIYSVSDQDHPIVDLHSKPRSWELFVFKPL